METVTQNQVKSAKEIIGSALGQNTKNFSKEGRDTMANYASIFNRESKRIFDQFSAGRPYGEFWDALFEILDREETPKTKRLIESMTTYDQKCRQSATLRTIALVDAVGWNKYRCRHDIRGYPLFVKHLKEDKSCFDNKMDCQHGTFEGLELRRHIMEYHRDDDLGTRVRILDFHPSRNDIYQLNTMKVVARINLLSWEQLLTDDFFEKYEDIEIDDGKCFDDMISLERDPIVLPETIYTGRGGHVKLNRDQLRIIKNDMKMYVEKGMRPLTNSMWKRFLSIHNSPTRCPLLCKICCTQKKMCYVPADNEPRIPNLSFEVSHKQRPYTACFCCRNRESNNPMEVPIRYMACQTRQDCNCKSLGFDVTNCWEGHQSKCIYSRKWYGDVRTFHRDVGHVFWIFTEDAEIINYFKHLLDLNLAGQMQKATCFREYLNRTAARINESSAPVVVHEAQGLFDSHVKMEIGSSTKDWVDSVVTKITETLQITKTTMVAKISSIILKLVAMFSSDFKPVVVGALLLDMLTMLEPDFLKNTFEFVKNRCTDLINYLSGVKISVDAEGLQVEEAEEVVAQGLVGDAVGFFEKMIAFITSLVGGIGFGFIPKAEDMTKIVNSIIKMGNLSRAVKCTWELMSNLFSWCHNKIYTLIYGVPPATKDMTKLFEDIDEFYTKTEYLINICASMDLRREEGVRQEIKDTYVKALELSKRVSALPKSRDIVPAFNLHFNSFKELFMRVVSLGPEATGARIPPYVILLTGGTAVGKTTIQRAIARDLLFALGLDVNNDEEACKHIYNRNVEQEFWDGYNFQEVCIYDDFAQQKDSQANPSVEFMELIRTNNTAPWHLHMAGIDQKDCTPFTSSIVILSSNMSYFAPESLVCTDAFRRRIDFGIEMRRNENLELPEGRTFSYDYSTYATFDATLRAGPRQPFKDYKDMIKNLTEDMINHRQQQIRIIREMNEEQQDRSYIYTNDDFLLEAQDPDDQQAFLFQEVDLFEEEHAEEVQETVETQPERKSMFSGLFHRHKEIPEAQGWFQDVMHPFDASYRKKNKALRDEGTIQTFEQLCQHGEVGNNITIWTKEHVHYLLNSQIVEKDLPRSTLLHHVVEDMDTLLEISDWLRSFIDRYGNGSFKKIVKSEIMSYAFFEKHWKIIPEPNVKAQALSAIALLFSPNMYNAEGHKVIAAAMRCLQKKSDYTGREEDKAFFTLMTKYVKPAMGSPGLLNYYIAWCEKNVIYMQEHPIMTALFLFGASYTVSTAIGLLMKLILEPKPNTETLTALSHAHEGLRLGSWARHAHECEKCGTVFTHGHIIKMQAQSQNYLHLCKACKKGSSLTNYGLQELQVSGDPTTIKRQNQVVELISSGDPKTDKMPKRRVEMTSSGDPNTIKRQNNKIEGIFSWFREPKCEDDDEMLDDLKSRLKGDNRVPGIEKFQEIVAKNESLVDVVRRQRILGDAQARIDENGAQIQMKVVNNCYLITLRKPTGASVTMRAIFVKGRYFLTVAHLFNYADPEDIFEIEKSGMTRPYVIPANKMRAVQLKNGEDFVDLAIVKCPRQIADHPDITNFFSAKQDHQRLMDFYGCLVFNAAGECKRFAFGNVKQNAREVHYKDPTGKIYVGLQSYQYSLETKAGDCGSPLFVVSTNFARKLVGIHIAGSTGIGFSTPVYRELVDYGLDYLGRLPEAQSDIRFPDLDYFIDEERRDFTVPDGQFMPLGKIKAKPGSSTTSKLRPSVLFHELPWMNTMLPAQLVPGPMEQPDGQILYLDPMAIGLKKAGVPCVDIDPNLINIASNDMQKFIEFGTREELRRVLTEEEMIKGIDGEEYMPAIRRSTSPGYPWSLNTDGKPGKTKWLGSEENFIYHPDLKAAVDMREELARKGQRMACFWVDTLKDERRPIEKVVAGKTRVFAAGPMDFTLLFRKYFLGICGHLEENRISNEICVGTNVYSYDWQRIVDKVTRFGGDHLIAGDFSNYDGTLQIDILEEMIHMINRWYNDSEENQLIRRVLWRDIINSIHIWGDNVYGWTHSQPSGCPMTAVLNSIYNSLSVRIVYLLLAPHRFCNMPAFHLNVAMVSYGDDNLIGVSPLAIEWFNQVTMAEAYKTIGMTYTDETKSGEMQPYRTLSEVGFLKRTFRWEPYVGRMVAPLSITTIREMVLWVRGSDNVITKTQENVQTALFECALHGEKFYNEMHNILVGACLRNRIMVQTATWIEQIGSRLADLTGLIVVEGDYDEENATHPGLQDTQYIERKPKALEDCQMTEGQSWLDLGELSLVDDVISEMQLVGDLFRLDGGQPPTEIMGSHPVCASAELVHNAQAKFERTNEQQNKQGKVENPPEEVFSNEVVSPILDVVPGSITQNTRTQIVDDFANSGPTNFELYSDSVSRQLRREVLMLEQEGTFSAPVSGNFLFSSYVAKAAVARNLASFLKLKGTWCVRLECTTSALDVAFGACGFTFGSQPSTSAEISRTRFSYYDSQRENSVTVKIPIGMANEYVSTTSPGVFSTPRFWTLMTHMVSATAPASYKVRVHCWMEDAVVAIPKAQMDVHYPPNAGIVQRSIEDFKTRIGEDEMDGLMTEKSLAIEFTFGKTSTGLLHSSKINETLFPATTPQGFVMRKIRQGNFGTLEVLLKAVKTPLHRGKLRITCTNAPADMDDVLQGHSVVWDLATDDTFVFRVPYNHYGRQEAYIDNIFAHGEIRVFVEQGLQCPSTVGDTLTILGFAGFEDFQILDMQSTITPLVVHEAQGLVIEPKEPAYTFPLQKNLGRLPGMTLSQMFRQVAHDPVLVANNYVDAATANNALILQTRTDLAGGLLPLLDYFTFWAGEITLEIMPTTATYIGGATFRLPYEGTMTIGRVEDQNPGPKMARVDTLTGQCYQGLVKAGESVKVHFSPFEGELGLISAKDLSPGSFVFVTGHSGTSSFPDCCIRLTFGENFMVGVRY